MTQGAAYGGKDQALINIRPRLPRIKLDHRSGRFLVAPSIRLGSPPSKGRNQCQRCFSRATASSPVTLLSSQAMVPISHPPIIAPNPPSAAGASHRALTFVAEPPFIAGSHAGRKIDRRLDVSRRQMGSAAYGPKSPDSLAAVPLRQPRDPRRWSTRIRYQ